MPRPSRCWRIGRQAIRVRTRCGMRCCRSWPPRPDACLRAWCPGHITASALRPSTSFCILETFQDVAHRASPLPDAGCNWAGAARRGNGFRSFAPPHCARGHPEEVRHRWTDHQVSSDLAALQAHPVADLLTGCGPPDRSTLETCISDWCAGPGGRLKSLCMGMTISF